MEIKLSEIELKPERNNSVGITLKDGRNEAVCCIMIPAHLRQREEEIIYRFINCWNSFFRIENPVDYTRISNAAHRRANEALNLLKRVRYCVENDQDIKLNLKDSIKRIESIGKELTPGR